MTSGTVYGVLLNDTRELQKRQTEFSQAPYLNPPKNPVLYIKTRNCLVPSGHTVSIPDGVERLTVAPTLALLFGEIPGQPVAGAIALDISEVHSNYYRPAVRQRCQDGFLPLGSFVAFDEGMLTGSIGLMQNEREIHHWSLKNLEREPMDLVRTLAPYMTLSDGDILLVGLPGDAPSVGAHSVLELKMEGLPSLNVKIGAET